MSENNSLETEHLFNDISHRYDLLNDLFSFGLHRIWKRRMLAWLNPQPGERWLDICCGTGDLAFLLASNVLPGGEVLGIDFAEKALMIARERHLKRRDLPISWLKVDATNTGLQSNEFDGIAMAYGLRNIKCQREGLAEIYRLLKPNSKALILDFNHFNANTYGGSFQKFYLRKLVVPLASKLGLKKEYSYIEESIRAFPQGGELERYSRDTGFSEAFYERIAFGQMGLLHLRT